MNKLALRGGNCGAIVNGKVRGGNNQCLRAVVVRAHCGQPQVTNQRSLITFAVGSAVENVAFKFLQDIKGDSIKQDVAICEEITEAVDMEGHADFVEKLPSGEFHGWEHKSVGSTSVAELVFKDAHYKPENAVQLVNYMISLEAETGTLQYTAYCYHNNKSKKDPFKIGASDQKNFEVVIKGSGEVIINEQPALFKIQDILEFRERAAELIEFKRLDDLPPEAWDNGFFSPCSNCWLENACEFYNHSRDKEKFFSDVDSYLDKAGRR
jgi:hypothetical protein